MRMTVKELTWIHIASVSFNVSHNPKPLRFQELDCQMRHIPDHCFRLRLSPVVQRFFQDCDRLIGAHEFRFYPILFNHHEKDVFQCWPEPSTANRKVQVRDFNFLAVLYFSSCTLAPRSKML